MHLGHGTRPRGRAGGVRALPLLRQLPVAVRESALVAVAAPPLRVPDAELLPVEHGRGAKVLLPVRERAPGVVAAPALLEGRAQPGLAQVGQDLQLLLGVRPGALAAVPAFAASVEGAHLRLVQLIEQAAACGTGRRILPDCIGGHTEIPSLLKIRQLHGNQTSAASCIR